MRRRPPESCSLGRRELTRTRVDLSALAHEVAAELQMEHPGRRVHMTVAEGMTADADATPARVIVRALLANAWKFTKCRADAHVEVGSTGVDGECVFFVRDDGAGFDMRAAQHLFGVFQRLVLRHGGRVWAEAETKKGATFHFTLPVRRPGAAPDGAPQATSADGRAAVPAAGSSRKR